MGISTKFQPKVSASKTPETVAAKQKRNTLVLKMKEDGAEKSSVLAFMHENTDKKGGKYFLGTVAARNEAGEIVRDPATGYPVESDTIFFFFPKKDGGQLLCKTGDLEKAEPVADMAFKPNERGAVHQGKAEDGTVYYLDKVWDGAAKAKA